MARATGRGEDRSSKAFRALLALYPAAFRDEYGRELRLLFIDRYRDAASDPACQSVRSATMGSTRAARRAGR